MAEAVDIAGYSIELSEEQRETVSAIAGLLGTTNVIVLKRLWQRSLADLVQAMRAGTTELAKSGDEVRCREAVEARLFPKSRQSKKGGLR